MSKEEEKKGDVAAKISACLLGAFVADAACMGLEWIYDPNEMRTTVDSVEEPEFKDPPAPRYFSSKEFPGHYGPGMLSPYGEQLLFVAEYCAGAGYDLNKKDMFQKMKDWSYSFGGRPDHALLTAVKACEIDETNCMGSNDDQAHCFTKAVAVTCLYFGSPLRHQKVEEAVRSHQEHDSAVGIGLALSNILNSLLAGSTLAEALSEKNILDGIKSPFVETAVKDAYIAKGKPLELTAAERGRSCHLPESFIIPLQAALAVADDDGDINGDGSSYASAVRENILASGDICSRAIMIGSILGLVGAGCPESFSSKLDATHAARVRAASEAIAELRAAADF